MNPLSTLGCVPASAGVEPLLHRLLCASVEAAVLAVFVALVAWLMRRRSPRLLCLLLLIVLIKPIVSLTIGTAIPILRLELPRMATSEMGAHVVSANEAAASRDPSGFALPSMILVVWFAGLTLALGYHLRSWFRLRRIIRGAWPASEHVTARYRALSAELGLGHLPRLRVTDALESPAIVGAVVPTILIPAWLAADRDRRKLDWAVRHELTHWRWLDPLSLFIRDVAVIIFWFHPAVRWSARRLVETMELACDRAMLRGPAEAADYAEQLFRILQNVRQRRRLVIAGGLFATRTQIASRISVLLLPSPGYFRRQTWWSAAAMILAGVLALAVGVRFVARAQADPNKTALIGPVSETVDHPSEQSLSARPPMGFGGYAATKPAGHRPMGFGGYGSAKQVDGQPMGFGGHTPTKPDNRQPMGFGGYSSGLERD